MKNYFHDSWDVAEFVEDQLKNLKPGSQSIMTIKREPSEGFCASIVIEELSEDTDENLVAQFFSATQVNT